MDKPAAASAPLVNQTYLPACLENGLLLRWPANNMPIRVYVAPFNWHEKSKQQNSYQYQAMVHEAFGLWSQLTKGLVSFQFVSELRQSQINVLWRRVDRKTLGHCEYAYSPSGAMYSAEIQIGISDGLVHPEYNNPGEVQHTVIHEIAHALGIAGHSDQAQDIMYVPHQYGIDKPSARDADTLRLLYHLPVGFDYSAVAQQLKLKGPLSFERTVMAYLGHIETTPNASGQALSAPAPKKVLPNNTQALFHQQDILTQISQFHIQTQHVKVAKNVKQLYVQNRAKSPTLPLNQTETAKPAKPSPPTVQPSAPPSQPPQP
jgi:hypothetical protein